MNFLKLTADKLDLNQINDLVVHESCGGVAFFVGTTRDFFEDKKVICLEYEAYESMAIKSLTKICDDIRHKWSDVKNIAMYHRLGIVPIKEASVIIGISSPHRKTCIDAVQFAIDTLKTTVPIWKKEKYSDSEELESSTPGRKKLKREQKLDFEQCTVAATSIPKNLIQIHADESEIARRVNCFVECKREEIGLNNIQDFIERESQIKDDDEYSCARVNSTVFRLKNSNFHTEVHRVKNEYGPQTTINYKSALDKLMENKSPSKFIQNTDNVVIPGGIKERLVNAETHLNIVPISNQTIYERLKVIEDRILYLETLSPEYKHFLQKTNPIAVTINTKKVHSLSDIDAYIKNLQNK